MSRRSLASILACMLLAALVGVAALLPVPYVTMSPGPTVDVLAKKKGTDIVSISGAPTYPTTGQIELTTILVTAPTTKLNLAEALGAWFDRARAVYPRDAIYAPDESAEDVKTEGTVQMVDSQDTAVAAALTELGKKVRTVTRVVVVSDGSPAKGKLKARDEILSVDGTPISTTDQVPELVKKAGIGATVTFVVKRDGRQQTVRVVPVEAPDDPGTPRVGVVVGASYDFPFDVSLRVSDDIGGPSAGLSFALAVYDKLTPGPLTGGKHVAGTGTISVEGTVGPIGGIEQKIVAASDAGADVFLVPPANCDAALGAAVSEDEITLVRAPSLHSAIASVREFSADPSADLPRCS